MSSRIAKPSKKKVEKHVAYEKKQEQEGSSVVKWIIGVLIVMALCYIVWTFYMML